MSVQYYMPDCVGYIERLDVFGSDITVVNAARVSFAKEVEHMETKDIRLLAYLAKHEHISPFFHPQIQFRIKMPIFVAREWFRHTIGLSRNEISRRYVDFMPQCWFPFPTDIRERDAKLKQGSKQNPVDNMYTIHEYLSKHLCSSIDTYNRLLSDGVAPEIARIVLPQSMYTEFIETGSLYAYARICKLRLDPTAQKEIRQYASLIYKALQFSFPHAWNALMQSYN